MGKRRANGEGSIRKRNDGSWEARILINGKSRSIYGRTQSDVRKKLTEVRNDLDNDEYLEPNDTTLKEWLELWNLLPTGTSHASESISFRLSAKRD